MRVPVSKIGEKMLLAGFFLTPFTTLRFGFVGPGEILILSAALIAVYTHGGALRLDARMQIFYRYWTALLTIMFLGLCYNSFSTSPSGRPGTPLFDFFAYIFILLSIVVTGHYSHNKVDFAMNFFRVLFLYWSLFYVALYAISFFTPSIFGMPLRYYSFFSPLVENVHQAASITCAMGFVALFLGTQSSVLLVKLFYIIIAVLFAIMALDSGSTKAMLGVVSGAIVSVAFLIGYRPWGKGRLHFNAMSILFTIIAALVLFARYSDSIAYLAVQFFSENDGGGAREALYSVGFEHGLDSLVVGYGPGSHSPFAGRFSDAHNTTLTIFLQSGLLGVFAFALFIGGLMRKLSVHFALLGVFAAIGMYVLGGDILRRLPIWIMLMGIVYFAADVSIRATSNVRGADWKSFYGLNSRGQLRGRPLSKASPQESLE